MINKRICANCEYYSPEFIDSGICIYDFSESDIYKITMKREVSYDDHCIYWKFRG